MSLSDDRGRGVQLNTEVIEAIRQFIFSDAWERFYRPALESMKQDWTDRLMDPSKERKERYPDDYIRGCFETIDVFLKLPDALIVEHDANREREGRERAEAGDYRVRSDSGYVGP